MNKEKIIKAAVFTPGVNKKWGLPIVFEGTSGSGKSSIITQVCERLGLPAVTMTGSDKEPTDFGGIPFPSEDGDFFVMKAPKWAYTLNSHPEGAVLFLDELSTCSPAVQNVMLQLFLERRVGDVRLNPRVRIIAATNSTQEAGEGHELITPLKNRAGHLSWTAPSIEEWTDYQISLGSKKDEEEFVGSATAEEERVMKLWPGARAKAAASVSTFLARNVSKYNVKPELDNPDSQMARGTPRTWEMAINALAGAEIHGLDAADTIAFIAGFVGHGPASEFFAWLTLHDLPDPAEVLDGKVKFKADKKRLDRTLVILNSCAGTVMGTTDKKSQEKRSVVLWGMLGSLVNDAPDLTVPAARVICKSGIGRQSKEAIDYLTRAADFLAAAGVRA